MASVTEKLKVAGSIQSTLAGNAGGYMFADTTNTHRESRLETAYALVPIGGVVAFWKFTGWFLPPNFKECDGTSVTDTNSPICGQSVPNLNGQQATIEGDAAGLGGFEGANTHVLTEAELPLHKHVATSSPLANHSHTDNGADSVSNPGDHRHYFERPASNTEVDSSWSAAQDWVWLDSVAGYNTGLAGGHTHTFTTSPQGAHTHTITVENTGLSSAVDMRQRSCQLTWIIRIK